MRLDKDVKRKILNIYKLFWTFIKTKLISYDATDNENVEVQLFCL